MGHLKEKNLNELLYICTGQMVKLLASDKLAVLTPELGSRCAKPLLVSEMNCNPLRHFITTKGC